MLDLLKKVYNYSEHKSSKEPNSISATGLLGSLYQGKQTLAKTPKNPDLIDFKFKRSSTLGSAFHSWAEKALDNNIDIIQEIYSEVEYKDYLITGSCDILRKRKDGKWELGDWKTGYGKKRTDDQLTKDMKQMSIYRWLLKDYDIVDTAYTIFISQSNNEQEVYELELMSIEKTQEFIDDKLFAIEQNKEVDCFNGVKYNPCTYCEFICENRKD